MSARTDRVRLRRLFFLLLVLIPVLQFPGDFAHTQPLQAGSISIIMSNPTCVQALPESGRCSIQVGYLTVSGSDPAFSRLEVLVSGKLRVYIGAFFESSAYLTESMIPGGLTVPCGSTGAGGLPNYGKSYLLMANAYSGSTISASDSMTVFCPAYDEKSYLPLIRK
jgi:hypothetical protein